uniref:hypothetical protein n=1 Tax=Amycolatopsis sp. CA-151526 TaxID=3239921 RepID=UPI003F49377A
MADIYRYHPDDYVAVVRPLQLAPLVLAGKITWQEAASGPDTGWAMSEEKAERVRVLLAMHEDAIEGAWRVTGATHHSEIPKGKTRPVNRTRFETVPDDRLDYLLKTPSPKALPRNPQGVLQLRDLPGADQLLSNVPPPPHGVVRLGPYTLTVDQTGDAELRIPIDARLAIRTVT